MLFSCTNNQLHNGSIHHWKDFRPSKCCSIAYGWKGYLVHTGTNPFRDKCHYRLNLLRDVIKLYSALRSLFECHTFDLDIPINPSQHSQ